MGLVPPLHPGSCMGGLGDSLAQGTARMAIEQPPPRRRYGRCKPIFRALCLVGGCDRAADGGLGALGGDRRRLEQALLVLGDLHA